jgi:hypothetical protein
LDLARNRYGWQKRAKELARKEKNDEKMKRRQGKTTPPPAEENPEVFEEALKVPEGAHVPDEDSGAPGSAGNKEMR